MSVRQTTALAVLQSALADAFVADGILTEQVFGRIHDGAPRSGLMPYLAFAEARCDGFSAGDGAGAHVRLTLEALAADGERGRAVAILDRAVAIAVETPPQLSEGTLVLIAVAETVVERLKDGRSWRASAVLDALVDG